MDTQNNIPTPNNQTIPPAPPVEERKYFTPTQPKNKTKQSVFVLLGLLGLLLLVVPGALTYYVLDKGTQKTENIQENEQTLAPESTSSPEALPPLEEEVPEYELDTDERTEKLNIVEEIEVALWGYYVDNREFPSQEDATELQCQSQFAPKQLIDLLEEYIQHEQLDGGSTGEFWYFWGNQGQEFILCAGLDSQGDEIFCTGNGLNTLLDGEIPVDSIYTKEHEAYENVFKTSDDCSSIWNKEEMIWQ